VTTEEPDKETREQVAKLQEEVAQLRRRVDALAGAHGLQPSEVFVMNCGPRYVQARCMKCVTSLSITCPDGDLQQAVEQRESWMREHIAAKHAPRLPPRVEVAAPPARPTVPCMMPHPGETPPPAAVSWVADDLGLCGPCWADFQAYTKSKYESQGK